MTETCARLTDASPFDQWEGGLVFRKVREQRQHAVTTTCMFAPGGGGQEGLIITQ